MTKSENTSFKVVKSTGYTVMGNHHLRNMNLSLKAKGLLSVMLSVSDTWKHSIAGYASICRDGVDGVRTTIKELEKNGYITRCRLRNEKGHLTITEYTIYELPVLENPILAKPTLEKPTLEKLPLGDGVFHEEKPENKAFVEELESLEPLDLPMLEKPILDNPTLEKPTLEKPRQLNTKELNTNKLNNKISNPNPYPNQNPKVCGYEMMGFDSLEALEQFVHKNIDYQFYNNRGNQEEKQMINMVAELIIEILCNTQGTINVSGQDFPSAMVKNRLMKFNATHVEYVRECLNKNKGEVRNIKRYLLATMFNAPVTLDSYYSAMVYHDLHKDEKSE